MKVAVVGPTYPFRGGIAHFTTLLVHHLRRRHMVDFYSYWRQYPAWLFPGNTDRDPSAEPLQEAVDRSLDPYNPLTWWRLARRLAADPPDLLLLQWWTPFWLPLQAALVRGARRAGVPVLFFCHQLVEPDSSPLEWQVARLGLRLGQAYLVVTERERAQLQAAYPQRRVVLGHHPAYEGFPSRGISPAEARAALGLPPLDTPVLLVFGFVRKYKGLRYLLPALAEVPGAAHLMIAGEFWEDEQEYHRLIADLGLTARVTIHNRYIPNEAIEPYFVAANALVLPYLSGSQSGVGMLAIQYGLPIIATHVGGLAETVRDGVNGLIVPPADSAALAAALRRFLAEALEGPMRAEAERVRARLSWPALIDLIEEIHDGLAPAG